MLVARAAGAKPVQARLVDFTVGVIDEEGFGKVALAVVAATVQPTEEAVMVIGGRRGRGRRVRVLPLGGWRGERT